MRRCARTGLAAVLVLLLVSGIAGAPASAAGVYQPIAGAGSTWSANALQQWIRNVFDNYRWKVTFDDRGSSAGRQLFSQGTVDFAVSEIPYALKNSDSPDPRPGRQFAYMPIVAGGTSFMYNLVIGGKRVTNLRLSGETVSKIFTGTITVWNDPAIQADNPKLALPATPIIPVVRSDGSGTTAQLTTWMRDQYPALWNDYCKRAGRSNCGITSNYPTISGSRFVAQQGSNGVSGYVSQTAAVGAITYVEYSYALNARFPVVKLLNAAGYYTEPTAQNVAVALLGATINADPNSPDYLTSNLTGVYTNPDARSYPLASYSYMIVPTAIEGSFTADKGRTLADFAAYFLCEGQQQAEVLGYSPLPINLVKAGLEQVLKIPGGDPQTKDISKCNNPTFSPDGSNKLALTAPQPPACDKKGADQCVTGTAGAKDQPTAGSASGGSGGTSGGAGSGDGPAAGGAEGGAVAGVGDGGEAVGLAAGGSPVVTGLPVEIESPRISMPVLVAALALALLVLAVAALPAALARRRLVAAGGSRAPNGRRRWPAVHLPAVGMTLAGLRARFSKDVL